LSGDPTLPNPPPSDQLRATGIRDDELAVLDTAETWWRVHRTDGAHVLRWNEFRQYGPVLRFDPHPEPPGTYPDRVVWYGASTPDAALAEAFQGDRTIDRVRERPFLTGLTFTRPLQLLNLAADSVGAWATRTGGNFAISTAPHAITQRWARAIVDAFPDLDGLRYTSRFAGHPCAALFAPAASATPGHPGISLPLTHPALVARLAGAAARLGYVVI
jgi:hypothetical protein